eukprot:172754_1
MSQPTLSLSIIEKFVVLADYYNSQERVQEELQFWYQDAKDGFIETIDKSYLKIMTIRQNKNKNKSHSKSINYNFASKLATLQQTAIALHHTHSVRPKLYQIHIQTVDRCILYYTRGKLKGLPSRIHLQMIFYGSTPHQKQIIEISKRMNEYMDAIQLDNKMKPFRNKMDITPLQDKAKHESNTNKKPNTQFIDTVNVNWTPPMTMDTLFYRLSLCSDRTKHTLSYEKTFKEIGIVYSKSQEELFNDAMKIIDAKIKNKPKNDWYQTPYHGHPVYIGMHATATCCRICLGQWFNISERGALTITQMKYIANVILKWIHIHCPPQFS